MLHFGATEIYDDKNSKCKVASTKRTKQTELRKGSDKLVSRSIYVCTHLYT